MESLERRKELTKKLWAEGMSAESTGDYSLAYDLYTEAHDGITDCPGYHQLAHVYLRKVNLKLGNYGELTTDWALHILAPVGVFKVIAFISKRTNWIV